MLSQGTIIKVEGIKFPVLVISKDFFNNSGKVIVCPIISPASIGPLHIMLEAEQTHGVVICEQLKMLDLKTRGYSIIESVSYDVLIDIVDAVQGIFDYI